LKYGERAQIFPKASFGAFSTPFICHVVAKICHQKKHSSSPMQWIFMETKYPISPNFKPEKKF